jgi:hypothetical protein
MSWPYPHRIVFQGGKLAEPRQAEPFARLPRWRRGDEQLLTDGPRFPSRGQSQPMTSAASKGAVFFFTRPRSDPCGNFVVWMFLSCHDLKA